MRRTNSRAQDPHDWEQSEGPSPVRIVCQFTQHRFDHADIPVKEPRERAPNYNPCKG